MTPEIYVMITVGLALGGSQIVLHRDFADLRERVTRLEERVATLDTRMTALEAELHGFMAGFRAKEA